MWLPLILISTTLQGLSLVFAKQSNKLNGAKTTAIFWLFWYHLITILIIIAIRPEYIINFSIRDLLIMLPIIIVQTLGFIFTIKALEYAAASIVTPIQRVSVVITIILGVLVLKEHVTLMQLIISAILLFLVIWLSRTVNTDSKNKNLRLGLIYTFLSVPMAGTLVVMYKIYIDYFGDPFYVILYTSISAFIGLVIYLVFKKEWKFIGIKRVDAKWALILAMLLDLFSAITHRFSLITGNVSVIAVITTASLGVTLLASRIYLKEKLSLKQYLIIGGIFISIVILALFKL